jgi:uncharacterized repeat protein (TIGR01451 family)
MTGVAALTPGGTTISNAVSVSYNDGTHAFTGQSNTVSATVASVSALVVSPKNAAVNPATDGFALGAPVTRTFTITNTSNIPDAYTLTNVSASAGTVTAVAFVAPGGTTSAAGGAISPVVQPGATISVTVTIATTGVPLGKAIAIGITARTTAASTQTGLVSDSGQQWAVATGVPQFGGPSGASSTVSKTVDGVPSESNAPGASVTYAIAFQNWGQVAATNATLTDNVPAGITADPTSVKLNGARVAATLSGQTLSVPLGTIAPGVPMTVTFGATVSPALTIGSTYVNVASLTADGLAAIGTTPASVFVGIANVVYDGSRGSQAPVAGALVALVDPATGQPLSMAKLPASSVRAPASSNAASINPDNANPFRTGPSGLYAFTIPPPAAGTTASFDIMVTSSGYLNRLIAAKLTPDATGTLYTVVLTAKDGQPLAAAGGYTLTTTSVMLSDVFSLLGNLPLFTPQSISVTKTADKTQAAPGDRIAYTVTFASTGLNPVGATTVTDTLPAGLAYAPGTARLDGTAVEPLARGSSLVWTVPALQPGVAHTITYECVMLPTVAVGTTLTNTVGVSGVVTGTQLNATGVGSVAVVAVDGTFSTQAVITGRVFIDDAKTGHFRAGDRPLEGVRLYLESGESVVTDPDGRFSFPGVRSGLHVLRLDDTTLPPTARTFADRRYDSTRSPIRLIHGTMDLGMLQDVNFALEPAR